MSKKFSPEYDYPKVSPPSGKPFLTFDPQKPVRFTDLADTFHSYNDRGGQFLIVTENEQSISSVDISGLFADIDHVHTKDQITDFSHTHLIADITDFEHDHGPKNDDDFYNRVSAVSSITEGGYVLVWDDNLISDPGFLKYRKITKTDLLSGVSTVQDVFKTITPQSGVSLIASGEEDSLIITADNTLLTFVGSEPGGVKTLSLTITNQSANRIYAGPSSGGAAKPLFRALTSSDMPSGYNSTNWNSAYTHSLEIGNPHQTTLESIGISQDNIDNWNSAYGWGDHDGLYSLLAHTHTFASLTSKPTTISGYGITDAYTKTESDALYVGLTGNQTIAGAKTFTGANIFYSGQKINNPANTYAYTLTSGAITANRTLNLPVITGTDTLATLGLAQTFTGALTASATPFTLSADSAILSFSSATGAKQITTGGTTNLGLNPGGDSVAIGGTTFTYKGLNIIQSQNANLGINVDNNSVGNDALSIVTLRNVFGVSADFRIGGLKTGTLAGIDQENTAAIVTQSVVHPITAFVIDVKDNSPIVFATNDTERARITGAGIVEASVSITTPTLKITTGATSGYYWRCTNVSGAGEWASISASLVYKGTWNANTNTPTLADGNGTAGWYYRVVVAGTQDLGSGNITFAVGDDVYYNGAIWEKIPGTAYVLQVATDTVLGGVKIGSGIDVDVNGVISVEEYEHPDTHPASIIVQDSSNRFVTDTQIGNWNTAYGWGTHTGLYSVLGHFHDFNDLTNKPTTLGGYGITNAYTQSYIDNTFAYDVHVVKVVGDQCIDGFKEFAKQIKLSAGSPGTGKILTSNSEGLASWETYSIPPSASAKQHLLWVHGSGWVNTYLVQFGDGSYANDSIVNIAIGNSAQVVGVEQAIAIGSDSLASGNSAISLGYGAETTGAYSIAIGLDAQSGYTESIAIGRDSQATKNYQIVLGKATGNKPEVRIPGILSTGSGRIRNIDYMTTDNLYTGPQHDIIVCMNNTSKTVYLNYSPVNGEQVVIKRAHTGGVTIHGQGKDIVTGTGIHGSFTIDNYNSHVLVYDGGFFRWLVISRAN